MSRVAGLKLLIGILLASSALAEDAPVSSPLSTGAKFRFHAKETVSPGFVVETVVYAGVLHWMNTPAEWGQGGAQYGKRVASAGGATAIRNLFAFTLDSALGEDPRYRRAGRGTVFRESDTQQWRL